MVHTPRIPELAQRDRFVRRCVSQDAVLTLKEEDLASVPSQKFSGRIVQLFWSSEKEGGRWAKALTGDAALQSIPLVAFAADILPGIAAAKGLVGTDWVSDPIEAEIDPRDLLLRLKQESLIGWLEDARDRREVYLVANDQGPALSMTIRREVETFQLSVFATRQEAERHVKQIGGRRTMADPLRDFVASTLPWAAARGVTILIEPIAGAGPLEIKAEELARCIPS